ARLWQEEAVRFPWLECTGGRKLRVLYPGRRSVEAGPDYRDALLQDASGALLRGDVELHLRPGGWAAHGHHRDSRYNSTVLHVVLWPDAGTLKSGEQTPLEAGAVVPVASMFPVLQRLRSRPQYKGKEVLRKEDSGEPLLARRGSPVALPEELRHLAQAGNARFTVKARQFSERIRAVGPEQALYEGVMEALGYHQNRDGFLALAAGLPLAVLKRAVDPIAPTERAEALEGLLIGAAGLAGGRTRWTELAEAPAVKPEAWDLFRCRPDNHPRRRLMGMARLLSRWWDQGLVRELTGRVLGGDVRGVLWAFVVSFEEGAHKRKSLIGPQRAGEIAVNVALPICLALGRRSHDLRLTALARSLYAAWPPLESNHMLREGASVLGIAADPARLSACRQQGVLHLYHQQVAPPQAQGVRRLA
ncbi:MAG: DUF2851 family protein, partial [Armatimonadetes bacterium]|nr:DUF2851 family protein [Armatimonadota bacterium]